MLAKVAVVVGIGAANLRTGGGNWWQIENWKSKKMLRAILLLLKGCNADLQDERESMCRQRRRGRWCP